MGNRRLYNKSRSEYKRQRQRETKRLTIKRRHQIRAIPREIPNGYHEIDKVVVGYICEYFKSINPRQLFSTYRQHTSKGIWLKHILPLCMYKRYDKIIASELTVSSVGYISDMVSIQIDITIKQPHPFLTTRRFKHQFSSPIFFQELLLFLDRMNLYYWYHELTTYIERLDKPILQRLLTIACLPHSIDCIESGKVTIGSAIIMIRDGYVLTNNYSIATLERAVLDPYDVVSKLREALTHELSW